MDGVRRAKEAAIAMIDAAGSHDIDDVIGVFKGLSNSLKNDKGVVLSAVRYNGEAFDYASHELKDDFDFVILILRWENTSDGSSEYDAADVDDNCHALKYVSDRLINSQKFAENLLKNHFISFNLRSKRMRHHFNNESFFLKVISEEEGLQGQDPVFFDYLPRDNNIWANKDFMLKAIKYYEGLAFHYAHASLRDDEDVVLAAIEINGNYLKYASERLKGNVTLVLKAVESKRLAIVYASDHLQDNLIKIYKFMNDAFFSGNASKFNFHEYEGYSNDIGELKRSLKAIAKEKQICLVLDKTPNQVDVVKEWVTGSVSKDTADKLQLTRQEKEGVLREELNLQWEHRRDRVMKISFLINGNYITLPSFLVASWSRYKSRDLLANPELIPYKMIPSYRPPVHKNVIKIMPDIYVRDYIFNSYEIKGESNFVGYKNDSGGINLREDLNWSKVFSDISHDMGIWFKPLLSDKNNLLCNINKEDLNHINSSSEVSFSKVLRYIQLSNEDSSILKTQDWGECLQKWLNGFSLNDIKDNKLLSRRLNELDSYASSLLFINDDIFKKLVYENGRIKNNWTCRDRSELFIYLTSLTPFKEDFVISLNQVHAFIVDKNSFAYDLGGVKANIEFAARAPVSNIKTSFLPITSQCASSYPFRKNQDQIKEKVKEQTKDQVDAKSFINPKSIRHFLMRDENERAPSYPVYNDNQFTARIIAPSWRDTISFVTQRYPKHYLFIIESKQDLNSSALKSAFDKGKQVLLLFNIDSTSNAFDDKLKFCDFQTFAKQCCDTESPKICNINTKNSIRLFYQGNQFNAVNVLPSLKSRVSNCFIINQDMIPEPKYMSEFLNIDDFLNIDEFVDIEVEDCFNVIETSLFDISIKNHSENGVFSRSVEVKGPLKPYLVAITDDEGMDYSCDDHFANKPRTVGLSLKHIQVKINKKSINQKDKVIIDNLNHNLSQGDILLNNCRYKVKPGTTITLLLNHRPQLERTGWSAQLASYQPNSKSNDPDYIPVSLVTTAQESPLLIEDITKDITEELPQKKQRLSEVIQFVVTAYTQLSELEVEKVGGSSDKSLIQAKKTLFCKKLEELINQGYKVEILGNPSNSFKIQLDQYVGAKVKYSQMSQQTRISCDAIIGPEIYQITGPRMLRGYFINNKNYIAEQFNENVVEGVCHKISQREDCEVVLTLEKWLERPSSYLLLDGSNISYEEYKWLDILKSQGPSVEKLKLLDFKGKAYQFPDKPLRALIINPKTPRDHIESIKLKGSLREGVYKELGENLPENTCREILDSLSEGNTKTISKLLEKKIPEKCIQSFFSNQKEKKTLSMTLSMLDGKEAPHISDDYINLRPAVLNAVMTLKECKHQGVLLEGPPGIGKSKLSICLAQFWQKNKNIMYFHFDGEPRDDGSELNELEEAYLSGKTVIIDEFEHPKWQEKLDELQSVRPNDMHENFFVIASSNYTRISDTNLAIIQQPSWSLEEKVEYINVIWDKFAPKELTDYKQQYIQVWKQELRSMQDRGQDARCLLDCFKDWVSLEDFCLHLYDYDEGDDCCKSAI